MVALRMESIRNGPKKINLEHIFITAQAIEAQRLKVGSMAASSAVRMSSEDPET
jgi:hypothetical protein